MNLQRWSAMIYSYLNKVNINNCRNKDQNSYFDTRLTVTTFGKEVFGVMYDIKTIKSVHIKKIQRLTYKKSPYLCSP